MRDPSHEKQLIRARLATTAIFLVQGMGMGAWAACIPALRHQLNLTDSALSLSLLAYAAGGLIGMPLSVWLVSRLDSHIATMSIAIMFSVSLILPGIAPTLLMLIGAALILGMGKGLVDVAMNTFALAIQSNWGSPILSSFHAAASAGGLLGAVWIGFMFSNGHSVLTGLSILTIISLTIVGISIPLSSGAKIEHSNASSSAALAIPTRALFGIGSLCFLVLLIEGSIADWSGVYMTTIVQVTTAQAAAAYAAFSIMMFIGRIFGDWLIQKVGGPMVLLVGATTTAIGLILALGFANYVSSILGFALVGLGISNLVPLFFSTASKFTTLPPATAIAMTATIGYAGFLVGPPLIGIVSDLIGLRLALLFLFAATLVIGVFGPKFLTTKSMGRTKTKTTA